MTITLWPLASGAENYSRNFYPFGNMAAMGVGVGFFCCVDFREFLQNSSSLKWLVRFLNNFTGLFLG